MAEEAAVAVALRIRPLLPKERAENCNICITTLPDSPQVVLGADKHFSFDHVFDPASTQDAVYGATVKPLLDAVFQGYNATAFAYGQTGSGKSFTMGTSTAFDDGSRGIIPRVICELFERVEHDRRERPGYQAEVHVSYVELYNEALRDLLHPSTPSKAICIREDEDGGIVLAGVKTLHVRSMAELLALVQHGTACRATAATLMNDTSSRSHSILTLHLHRQEGDAVTGVCQRGKFHLVDLAGSERNKRTGNVGIRFKESVGINAGLLALGNVISVLSDERRRTGGHVPYRDSKLTRLLQDSLGGNSRTVMLACISPADVNFEETLSTLKYASRARNIKNTPVINRVSLAALREKQLSLYFGSPPPKDDSPSPDAAQYTQQLEQEVVYYQQQLRATEEALRKAQIDLQKDEEIFEEKLKEFKAQRKAAKDLARRNEALAADLRHAVAHALQPLLACADPRCAVRAARDLGSPTWGTGLRAAHDCLRKQSADLAASQEEGDEVEVASVAEADNPIVGQVAEDPAVAAEMERVKEEAMSEMHDMEESFEAFKRQLLAEIKSLTIHNQLKEQLICELLKTEGSAVQRTQWCEAKVHGLEGSIALLQEHIQRLKAALESTEQESAGKEAARREALAKLRRAERELGQLRELHTAHSEQMARRIQNLERQARAQSKSQTGQKKKKDKSTPEWLEREIERCLRNKEQAEKLERELKKRERLVREREILLQQREALEKRRAAAAPRPSARGAPRRLSAAAAAEAEMSSPLLLSDEEERTLLELEEESESKEEMLSYVDRVIEEARRDLAGADTIEMGAYATPADLKRLAAQRLQEKFEQSLSAVRGMTEAKALCLQYMTKVVDCKEAEQAHRRRVTQLEALLAEQRQHATEVGRELQALTEEYGRLREEVRRGREESEQRQLDTSSALSQDVEYHKNANRMLKARLREVLLEYNEQRAAAERDREMMDDLRQQKALLQEQLANLKAHLHNWSHIREQRVDPAKLRPLPAEALQERRERSLNASLATAVGAGEPGLTTPGRPAGHREDCTPRSKPAPRPTESTSKSSTPVQFSNSDSLLELLRGFEASKAQSHSTTRPPQTPPITVGDLFDAPAQALASPPEGLSLQPLAGRGDWDAMAYSGVAEEKPAVTLGSLSSLPSGAPSSIGPGSLSPTPLAWADSPPPRQPRAAPRGSAGGGGGLARNAAKRGTG